MLSVYDQVRFFLGLTGEVLKEYIYWTVNMMAGLHCCCRKGSQSPLAVGPATSVRRLN